MKIKMTKFIFINVIYKKIYLFKIFYKMNYKMNYKYHL